MLSISSVKKRSRFGFDQDAFLAALPLLQDARLRLRGVAFHLDSQSLEERSRAVAEAARQLVLLQSKGFPKATVLDMGGGYGDKMGLRDAQIEQFETLLKRSIKSSSDDATLKGKTFGIRRRDGRLYGELSGINYTKGVAGNEKIARVLKAPIAEGTVGSFIRDNLIELWMEPGNAIAAGSGLIAAEVIDVCWRDGKQWIVADLGRNQLCFGDNEHISDPLLIPRKKQPEVITTVGLLGHLCMETDLLSYRPITFETAPQLGDMLVFAHTGAYSTEFSASRAIGHPLPARYWLDDTRLKKDTL